MSRRGGGGPGCPWDRQNEAERGGDRAWSQDNNKS